MHWLRFCAFTCIYLPRSFLGKGFLKDMCLFIQLIFHNKHNVSLTSPTTTTAGYVSPQPSLRPRCVFWRRTSQSADRLITPPAQAYWVTRLVVMHTPGRFIYILTLIAMLQEILNQYTYSSLCYVCVCVSSSLWFKVRTTCFHILWSHHVVIHFLEVHW